MSRLQLNFHLFSERSCTTSFCLQRGNMFVRAIVGDCPSLKRCTSRYAFHDRSPIPSAKASFPPPLCLPPLKACSVWHTFEIRRSSGESFPPHREQSSLDSVVLVSLGPRHVVLHRCSAPKSSFMYFTRKPYSWAMG